MRTPAVRHRAGRALADLLESGVRVVRRTHLPTRRGLFGFFADQLLVNAVAWTAGVAAAVLVKGFFEVRSIRNLWGLAASGGRTVVSADDYRMIMGLMAYSAGLVMLIVVRGFVLRLIAELRSLRLERVQCEGTSDSDGENPARPHRASIDGFALDFED